MWTLAQAAALYALDHWSEGYFRLDDRGHLRARPRPDAEGPGIDLYQVALRCRDQGLDWPVLLRFVDILDHRLERLCAAFDAARARHGYAGDYRPLYPVKVNQQGAVVRRLLAAGGRRLGLEAGSKPELLAVLGLLPPGGLLVCNGYKDRDYLRHALAGQRTGLQVYIVIEKLSELPLVLELAEEMAVTPRLGVRIRLSSVGAGKWQNSGGEKAKFGLDAAQVLTLVERLGQAGHLDWLRLVHAHLGSQVPNLRDIERAASELARCLVDLQRRGVALEAVDAGGGLGVDYEGTASRSHCSINYGMADYADTLVRILGDAVRAAGLPPPTLLTESGRALTAHHAVLVTNVIDREAAPGTGTVPPVRDDEPEPVRQLGGLVQRLSARNVMEIWHEGEHWLAVARDAFLAGRLDLAQRARAEALYFALCHQARPLLRGGDPEQRRVRDELNEKLADKYFLNFSLFQSLPDVWAIDQIFPVMPLHRLEDPPTRRALLQDLTCDSDGRIGRYVGADGVASTLPVHPWRPGETYLMGIFLVGAYQETLGDMHNLFGDTHVVDVALAPDGGFQLETPERGDRVDELLAYVHLDTASLVAGFRARLGGLEAAEAERLLARYRRGLRGYSYLSDGPRAPA